MINSISSSGSMSYQKLDSTSLFKKIDSNQDGKIDKSEFEEMSNNTDTSTSGTSGTNAEDIFSEMDSNQDGSISQDENDQFIKKLQENTDIMMAQMRGMDSTGQMSGTNASNTTDDTDTTSKVFSEMDTNQDGTVSQDELAAYMDKMQQQMMEQMPGMNGPVQNSNTTDDTDDTDTTSKVFSEMDTNQDGTVSQDELAAYMDKMQQQMMEQMPRMNGPVQNSNTTDDTDDTDTTSEVFSEMDTNQDGTVSQDELAAYMDKMQQQMMEQMPGTNASGQNSATSNTGNSSKVFSEMDTNKDGTVSQEELKAFMDKTQESSNASDNNNNSIQYSREIQQYIKNYNIMSQDTTSQLSYTV